MAWKADPKTGKVVNVPDGASALAPEAPKSAPKPEGKVSLVDAQGQVFDAGADWVQRQIDDGVLGASGYRIASDKDVAAYDEANRDAAKPLLDKAVEAERAARAAGMAGTIDAATAVVRAPVSAGAAILGYDDPLEQVSGRRVLENVGYLAAEAMGGSGEATARNIQREQAYLAEKYPGATAVGEIGGQIAGSLPSLAAGAGMSALGRVGLGAVEGAGLGASTAHEDAYLKNRQLTRDQLLASVGIGALVGGITSAGAEGLSAGARRLFQARTGKGAAGAVEAEAPALRAGGEPDPGPLGGYRTKPADYDAQIRAATGQEPAPGAAQGLLETVEGLQSAATGAERGTLQKFGAFRSTPEAATGRSLWRNREKILDQSAKRLTEDLDELIAKRPDIFEEVVDTGLKRENVATKISGDAGAQMQAANAELARLRQGLQEIAIEAETYGNKRLVDNTRKLIHDLADTAKRGDVPDAFIALDQAKRALQRERVHVGRSALRQQDAFMSRQARALGDKLEEMQEGTRQLLMSDELWGAAGADQRAINSAWEDWFASRRLFERNLLTQVGESFDGRPIMRADPDKIAGYLGKLGREQGALLDEQTRHHVAATQRLTGAIGEAFDLGAKKAIVDDLAAASKRIAGTLDGADRTIKVANQIDAVIAAEASGGPLGSVFSGAAIGTLAGGPIGTAIGAAASVLTRPGSMIRTRAAVEAMARESESRIAQAVLGLLEGKATKQIAGKAPRQLAGGADDAARALPGKGGTGGGRRAAERTARLAAVDAFASPGEDDRKAYKRRADELAQIQIDPVGTHKRVTRAIQGTADVYPDLAAETAMAALRAQAYLAAKLPVSPTDRDPFTGKPVPPNVTDDDIDTFKAHWDAVRNPLGVLSSAARGQLLTEQVEAIRTVYPALYERIRFVVSEQLATGKHDPSYDTRIQLDLLLDLNGRGEPTLAPEFQRTLAMVAETPEAGPEGAPQGGSGRVNPRMANAYQTTATQVEAGL